MPPTQPPARPKAQWKIVGSLVGIIAGLVAIVAAGRATVPAPSREWEPRVSALEQQVSEIKPAVARIDERTAGMKEQLNQIQGDIRRNRQQP
jgi:hypothetical protein